MLGRSFSLLLLSLALFPVSALSSALRLDRAVVLDPNGFGQPVVAGTLFVPHGWQSQGGIEWGNQHSCVNGYAIKWLAQAPDGSAGLAALPQQQWEWNASGKASRIGCTIAQLGDAEAYLRALAREVMPNSQVLEFRPRKDLEREHAGSAGVTNDGFQYIEKHLSAGQLFIEFTDEQGRRLRGSIIATLLITYIRTGGGDYGATVENWTGYAAPAFASWALAESYDPAVFEALRRTYVENPPWQRLIAAHNAKMSQIEINGILKRAAIHNAASREINQIIHETWQNQQQSSDYRAREFIEYLRDVETYSDWEAPGGTVALSSFYDQAWKLEDGTYVLTSDPSFNPYQTFGISGQQLNPAP